MSKSKKVVGLDNVLKEEKNGHKKVLIMAEAIESFILTNFSGPDAGYVHAAVRIVNGMWNPSH